MIHQSRHTILRRPDTCFLIVLSVVVVLQAILLLFIVLRDKADFGADYRSGSDCIRQFEFNPKIYRQDGECLPRPVKIKEKA